jgi:signal transduction histidine kinase
LLAAGFVVVVPAVLGLFDLTLPASELALVGSLAAGYYLIQGSLERGRESRVRNVSPSRGHVAFLVVVVLWVILSTIPLVEGATPVLDSLTALLWSGAGAYIVMVGFRRDDEVVSALGIAALALGATELLNLAGVRSMVTEITALGAVALAVASTYIDLAGLVDKQRGELYETRESMRDLAHEARTAITAIEGTLWGLDTRSDLTPQDRESLRAALRIELQSLRLMLTDDQEPVSPVSLASVLDPVVTAARVSGVDVRWSGSRDLEGLFTAGALTEIVRALIDNARIHSGVSEIAVEVAEVGSRVEVRIIDQGVGIPDSIRDSLFERGVKRRGSPGRGLGLNIAQRLAVTHGGELEYRASPSGGAQFVLSMPLAGRLVDLSLYEDEQLVEIVDTDGPSAETASSDGHRRDSALPGEAHRHRGPNPGGEVAGV